MGEKEPNVELHRLRRRVADLERAPAERQRAEERLEHLNLVLRTIRRVNQLITRERDRDRLLQGACARLIETRGYYNAWIALLDEAEGLVTTAEAGLGEDFTPLVERLNRGELTACGRQALTQSGVVVTEDPPSACADCPLLKNYGGRGAMTVRLEHGGKVYGLLAVSIPAHLIADREEEALFEEVAGDIAFALLSIELEEERVRAEWALRERVKELICLYAVSRDMQEDLSVEEFCRRVIKHLLSVMRFPEITVPVIELDGRRFTSERTTEGLSHGLHAEIRVGGEARGKVWVYYAEERPFVIPEEQNLVNGVAEALGQWLERKRTEELLRESRAKLQRTLEKTVGALSSAIEMRDPYTAGHQRQVARLARAIAWEMGLSENRIEGIHMAAKIHDIGKIDIPAEILSKPSQLIGIEFDMIKHHPQLGYDILKEIEFPWPVAEIVLQHHERMDGSGHPQGLSGEEILLEARILAVADVVEAMASHRPYRPAHRTDKALEEISQQKGILYDPQVVEACLKVFTEKGFELE